MQQNIKKSTAKEIESIAGLIGWCFVGALAFMLLFFVVDSFVMGFNLKSLTLLLNSFFEHHKSTFSDSLGWEYAIYLFIAIVGAIVGFFFGIWRLIRRSRQEKI